MNAPAAQARRISEMLGLLRAHVDQVEADWRRRFLPPLSRDAPVPDPAAVHGARKLEAAGRALDAIGGQLRTLPSTDAGRLVARHGPDAAVRLTETGDAVLAHGDFLLDLLVPRPDGAVIDPDALRVSIAHLHELMQRRGELLS